MKLAAMNAPKQRGFTLIELMVVVAILAIITGIAVSAFSGAGKEAEQSRIMAELNSLNDAISRYYQGGYSYTGADAGVNLATLRGGNIAASPNYTVTLTLPTGQSYFLIARPVAGSVVAGTGAYSINETGRRCYYDGNDGADPVADAATCKAW